MKLKEGWVAAAALAAIAVVSMLAYRHVETTSTQVCTLCEREMHPATAFHLTTEGETIHVCCPRCGLHYSLQHPDSLTQAVSTDANTLAGISILSFPFTRKPMPATLSCQPQTALASLR